MEYLYHETAMMNSVKTWVTLAFIVFLIFIAGAVYYSAKQKAPVKQPTKTETETSSSISLTEQKQIMDWIRKNNLNFYGDPKETAYAGGTPLFNEATGKYINRFDYIIRKHPDRPWKR